MLQKATFLCTETTVHTTHILYMGNCIDGAIYTKLQTNYMHTHTHTHTIHKLSHAICTIISVP